MNNPDKNSGTPMSLEGLVAAHKALNDKRARGEVVVDNSPEVQAVIAAMMAGQVADLMADTDSGSNIMRFDPDGLSGGSNWNPDGLI